MSFWDHLEDLRKSIIRVVLALVGATVFLFLFKNFLFDGIVLAPAAGKNLFGDAAIGEYFRVFISYGVIALALVMHAWSGVAKKKKK